MKLASLLIVLALGFAHGQPNRSGPKNPDSKKQDKELPNFVFIMTDDQGYGDLGCYGGEGQDTSAIDQLAKEGTKCSSFFVRQRCSPRRAAFMTGFYAHWIRESHLQVQGRRVADAGYGRDRFPREPKQALKNVYVRKIQ